MLLENHLERTEAIRFKNEKILDFLATHRYSTLRVLTKLLDAKSKSTASRVLKKLCENGYVQKAEIKDAISKVVVFGITKKGIKEFNLNTKNPFIKSKVSLRTLAHKIGVQFAHIYLIKQVEKYCLNENLTNRCHNPDYLKNEIKEDGKKVFNADLIFFLLDEKEQKTKNIIYVEVETSLKSYNRYKQIILNYYAIKRESLLADQPVKQIIYIFNDNKTKDKFKEMVSSYRRLMYHEIVTKKRGTQFEKVWEKLFSYRTLDM